MKKVTILTLNEGHLSLAKAVSQKLSAQYDCTILPYLFREFDFYLPIYRLFPSLFKLPYKMGEVKQIREFVKQSLYKKYRKKIENVLEKSSPDVLISTYLLYDEICADYAKERNIPCFNVIANPRTIHPLEACTDPSVNLAFDPLACAQIEEYGVSPHRIAKSGWFVRSQFTPSTDKKELRIRLGLDPNIPVFVFTAGSDGSSTILKILPLFFQLHSPIQAVFICGTNRSLYKSLRFFEKTLHAFQKKSDVRFDILHFIDNIHEYIQASDLVIGKAGPNSLFETVACHVPFFAITHISGQEDGNLDIIRESNLGVVEENPLLAIRALKEIIEHPEVLSQYKEPIQKMATYNEQSGKKLLELLDRV